MDEATINFYHHGEENEFDQEEEALSLSDFPLISSDEAAEIHPSDYDDRRRSSPPEFFEFFNNCLGSDQNMSHAEEIISGGMLMPYKLRKKPSFDDEILKSVHEDEYDNDDVLGSSRRYCESLPELNRSTRSNSGSNTKLRRSSRSVDFRDSHRNSNPFTKPEAAKIHRRLEKKSFRESKPRPRWYSLMFGLVKFPVPEMDLREMKSRQFRRKPVSVLASGHGGGGSRSDRRSSLSDDLLRVLSCRDDACVAVTASINGLVPQV